MRQGACCLLLEKIHGRLTNKKTRAGRNAVMRHRSKVSNHHKITVGIADKAALTDAPVVHFGMKFMAG